MAVNSLVRVRRFSPDSMLYVDAARNVAAGRGLVSNIVGLNQPGVSLDDALPVPFITYAPLYPFAIAGVARLGPEAAEAALLVAVLGWLAIVLLGYALAGK